MLDVALFIFYVEIDLGMRILKDKLRQCCIATVDVLQPFSLGR